ncbi:MAG: hypothetical protein M5U34_19545 [Chloroflexi bacterium]|nr:hypothetical protein [Chloroflexota bacterium]
MVETLRKNRTRLIVLAVLAFLFLSASLSMDAKDWLITVLRGLSVGAIIFLVAAGFSLIFGLMDVLNLAHGELFMMGAYIGWTIYVRPDTFVDGITPLALLAAGLVLLPVLYVLTGRWWRRGTAVSLLPWVFLILSLVLLYISFTQWPLAMWDPDVFQESPGTYALALSQDKLQMPEAAVAEGLPPIVLMGGILLGGVLLALAVVGLRSLRKTAVTANHISKTPSSSPLFSSSLASPPSWATMPCLPGYSA